MGRISENNSHRPPNEPGPTGGRTREPGAHVDHGNQLAEPTHPPSFYDFLLKEPAPQGQGRRFAGFTQRDLVILSRHGKTRKDYEPNGGSLSFWGDNMLLFPGFRERLTTTIADILPSHPTGRTPLLVSVSSNTGLNEQAIANELSARGRTYRVIAGDMANLQRIPSQAKPVRLDASFLPFPKGRVSAIFDWMGALWHEATADSYGTNELFGMRTNLGENTSAMFEGMKEILHVGGVVIVDDGHLAEVSTGKEIDDVLGRSHKMKGFSTRNVGAGNSRMRIYTKEA